MKNCLLILLLLPFMVTGQSISITGTRTSICVGGMAGFSATVSGISNPHWQWKLNGSNVGTDVSTYVTGGLNNGDSIVCQATNAARDTVFATSNVIVMRVNALPNAGTITGGNNVCLWDSITLTPSIQGGVWIAGSYHISIRDGVVTGIRDGGFECSAPYKDTVYYALDNGCGPDTTEHIVTVQPLPNPYFEIWGGYGYVGSTICIGFYQYRLTTGTGDFLCEGTLSSKRGLLSFLGSSVFGTAVGVDTIINVSSNYCGTKSASMILKVIDRPRSVSIEKYVNELCMDATDSIRATNSGFSQSWTSKNSNLLISQIASGLKITGRKVGLDTVKLRLSNQCGSVDTSVIVKVNPIPSQIAGTDSVCKDYSIHLSDSMMDGNWGTLNNDIVGVNEMGVVTGLSNGVGTVKYSTQQGCSVTKNVRVSDCESEYDVFPNPATEEVYIHLHVNIYSRYVLMNAVGQILVRGNLDEVITPIDLTKYQPGMYIIRLIGDNKSSVIRLIKE